MLITLLQKFLNCIQCNQAMRRQNLSAAYVSLGEFSDFLILDELGNIPGRSSHIKLIHFSRL